MLTREGSERTIAIDMKLAAVLSVVAGAVNSAGFHALGFFSANMTGNASMLSDFLAVGNIAGAAGFLMIIVLFIAGAFSAARMIAFGRRRAIRAIYAYVISFEAIALIMLGLIVVIIGTERAAPFLLLGLSFLMGLQNAATTRISNSRVRTTHISGVATDIGISLAALNGGAGADEQHARSMLRLHVLTIACFISGGVAGVMFYEMIGGVVLTTAGALLLAAALREVDRTARPPAPSDR